MVGHIDPFQLIPSLEDKTRGAGDRTTIVLSSRLGITEMGLLLALNVWILSFKYVDNSTMEANYCLTSIKSILFDRVFTISDPMDPFDSFLGVALTVVS